MRLAWSTTGLRVRLDVRAPEAHEVKTATDLWKGDSVELFFSTGKGSAQRYQLMISPGVAADQPAVREQLNDHRTAPSPIGDRISRTRTADGYALDVLLPWRSLGVTPAIGTEAGFNAYINHTDAQGVRSQLAWAEGTQASSNPSEVNTIRLAERPSPPVNELVSSGDQKFRRIVVSVESTETLTGRALTARIGRHRRADGIVDTENPHYATFTFPMPKANFDADTVRVKIDRRDLLPVPLPDLAELRDKILGWQEFGASPAVFTQSSFPWLDYRQPNLVEDVVGEYKVRTAFYDKNFNSVKTPSEPGRYGAVSVVTLASGATRTYYTTLYRAKKDLEWRDKALRLGLSLPDSFGPDPAIVAKHTNSVSDGLKSPFFREMWNAGDIAVLLAGLDDLSPLDPDVRRKSSQRVDDAWWIGLKKKLGVDVAYKYITRLPAGYDPAATKRWPLLVFLHGSGDYDKVDRIIAERGIQEGAKRDFVLVAPSAPPDTGWSPELVNDLVTEAIAKYNIDPARVCLTGLSMGGFGTYDTAMQYPGRFAAIAPVCGDGDLGDIDRIKSVPIWIFHGEADTNVLPAANHAMAEALEKLGAPVKSSFYPGVGHDSWMPAYATPELWTWLLAQRAPHSGI